MVVTNCLTKSAILGALLEISSELRAHWFLKNVCTHHGLPIAFTSDRKLQFVGNFWTCICKLLKVKQWLSIGFHPQTNEATKRANQEVEKTLQIFVLYAQVDWETWLPVVMMALNNRTTSLIGLSPFFFMHSYHLEPIAEVVEEGTLGSTKADGKAFVQRLKEATNWAQAAITMAQDRQQE